MLRRPKHPSSSAIFSTGRSSVGSRVLRAAWTSCWKFFLKRSLFFLVGLGMTRTRSQLAPAMSMQEAVDGVDMDFLLHLLFIGLLNLLDRGHLSPFGPPQKALQKAPFLPHPPIALIPSALGC